MNPEIERAKVVLNKWLNEQYQKGDFDVSMQNHSPGCVALKGIASCLARGLALSCMVDMVQVKAFADLHAAMGVAIRSLDPLGMPYRSLLAFASIIELTGEALKAVTESQRG